MSAFPLLLHHLFSSWKCAFLRLLFVVDVALESFVDFCIQCQLQLQLCCGFPSLSQNDQVVLSSSIGHLILLTHLVHFLLCLSPVSSSECILASLFFMFACFPARQDCSGLRRLSFKTDYLSSVPVTQRQLLQDFTCQNSEQTGVPSPEPMVQSAACLHFLSDLQLCHLSAAGAKFVFGF